MPGAPNLKQSNPLKKLIADTVFHNAVSGLTQLDRPNIENVWVRRISDLRFEVEVVQRVSSANLPSRLFTVQVIEHQ